MRRNIVKGFEAQNAEHEAAAAAAGLGWEVAAAAVIERTPVVTPELADWEKDWMELEESLEYYKLHDWPKGIGPSPPDETVEEQSIPFEFAPRETAADAANDLSSLDRRLPDSLYLTLKTGSSWGFPEVPLREAEMLGPAAERAVGEALRPLPLRLFHFGKQPIGHLWRPFDAETQKKRQLYGSKVYFFSALVIDPYEAIFADDGREAKVEPLAPHTAVAWHTKDELSQALGGGVGEYVGHLLCA